MDEVRTRDGWADFWGAITGSAGPALTVALSILAVAILVFTLAMFLWHKMRGKESNRNAIIFAIVIGAAFAAPGIIFPVALWIVDAVANMGLALIDRARENG